MVPPILWYSNEKVEIKTKDQAELLLKDVSEEEWEILLDVLNEKFWEETEKVDAKEIVIKSFEFEDKNHREKSDNTRKRKTEEARIWSGKEFEDREVEVIINPEGDIKEYVSGVPAELVGEQLFNVHARRRLWLLNKLPPSRESIEEMINTQPWKDQDEKYTNFYNKNIKNNKKNNLIGFWKGDNQRFEGVNQWMYCWLHDDRYARFDENGLAWGNANTASDFLSIRLLKN